MSHQIISERMHGALHCPFCLSRRALVIALAGRPTVGVPLAPSKTPTVKQQQQAAAARKATSAAASSSDSALQSQHSIDEALHDLHDLHLAPPAGDSSGFSGSSSSNGLAADAARKGQSRAGAGAAVAWRPLEDYCMEADLARWASSSGNRSSSSVIPLGV
jgi:hypothetical protein